MQKYVDYYKNKNKMLSEYQNYKNKTYGLIKPKYISTPNIIDQKKEIIYDFLLNRITNIDKNNDLLIDNYINDMCNLGMQNFTDINEERKMIRFILDIKNTNYLYDIFVKAYTFIDYSNLLKYI
jgi:hypothetical protein